jgi:hypothetical protein
LATGLLIIAVLNIPAIVPRLHNNKWQQQGKASTLSPQRVDDKELE